MTEKDQQLYEKVDRYLQDKMESNERIAFEKELQIDVELQNLVQLNRELIPIINPDSKKITALRESLIEIGASKSKNSSQFKIGWFLSLAAAILLIFGMLKFLPSSQADALEGFYNYEKLQLVSKSAGDIQAAQIEKAFNSGEYLKVKELITNEFLEHNTSSDIILAKGIAEMETGNISQSIQIFESLKTLDLRVDKSDWYTSLAHLKNNNKSEALIILHKIIADKGYNHVEAQKLVRYLD